MSINITVTVERIGRLSVPRSISVVGHERLRGTAGGLLCSSISFLFRTIANSLVNTPSIDVGLSHKRRGMLIIDIRSYSSDMIPVLIAMYNLVVQGVHDLKYDYPDEIFLDTIPHKK